MTFLFSPRNSVEDTNCSGFTLLKHACGIVFFAVVMLFFLKSFALEEWDNTSVQGAVSDETLVEAVSSYVKTPNGGLSWDILAKTSEQEVMTEEKIDGQNVIEVRPVFSEDVRKLDGQIVTMQGFMFPLEKSEKQGRFLFGPFPMSCPYHYHVGPNMVIEVYAREPIPFTFDALTLSGQMELVPVDEEYNIFYRMKDVAVITP